MDERRITRRPQCVLVVDDTAARESWTAWLTLWGFRPVDAAADGRDALIKAAAHQPSVILMDVWTSMLGGTAAIERLKQHPATAHIPVIALTADESAPAHASAFVGAARIVGKPCEANVLLEHIRAVMRRPIME